MGASRSAGEQAGDAARWWRAYVLAGNDQEVELRGLAETGDGHARSQLAGWLSDRGRSEEAIEVIRPLADAGDDVAELWLARWLADGDHLDELRQRAASGSDHAHCELARLLAEHDLYDELRERASSSSGGYYALRELARRLAQCDRAEEQRELATAADMKTRCLILGGGRAGRLGSDQCSASACRLRRQERPALAGMAARPGGPSG